MSGEREKQIDYMCNFCGNKMTSYKSKQREVNRMEDIADIPGDFKLEHDRLINELEPIAERIMEIMQEVPKKAAKETIYFKGFTVTIKHFTEKG